MVYLEKRQERILILVQDRKGHLLLFLHTKEVNALIRLQVNRIVM